MSTILQRSVEGQYVGNLATEIRNRVMSMVGEANEVDIDNVLDQFQHGLAEIASRTLPLAEKEKAAIQLMDEVANFLKGLGLPGHGILALALAGCGGNRSRNSIPLAA